MSSGKSSKNGKLNVVPHPFDGTSRVSNVQTTRVWTIVTNSELWTGLSPTSFGFF